MLRALDDEQRKLSVTLNAEGMTHTEIAEKIGVDRRAISRYLVSQGLRSPYVRSKIIDLGNGMVQCTKCDRELPREDLPWGRVAKDPYQLSYCRGCLTAASIANTRRSVPQYLKHRQRAIKHRCRDSGHRFELPGGYLADLYQVQQGLCFYTDEPMQVYFGTNRPGSRRDSLSVDKVIPERGYVPGNVVLCIARANSIKHDCTIDEMKRWMPGWYARVVKLPGWEDFMTVGEEERTG